MFLLDTDVISNLRKPKPHPDLVEWLEGVDADELAVSVQTIFEIRMGVELIRKQDIAKADEILAWLKDFALKGRWQIVPVDAETSMLAAQMWSTPALKNFIVQDPRSKKIKTGGDLMIAATAIRHQATIMSFNAEDFVEINALFPIPGVVNPDGMQWLVGEAPGTGLSMR